MWKIPSDGEYPFWDNPIASPVDNNNSVTSNDISSTAHSSIFDNYQDFSFFGPFDGEALPLLPDSMTFPQNIPPDTNMHKRSNTAPVASLAPVAHVAPIPTYSRAETAEIDSKFMNKDIKFDSVPPVDNEQYYKFCKFIKETDVMIDAIAFELIPSMFWKHHANSEKKSVFKITDLIFNYFYKKNNKNARFQHKLFNALKISQRMPALYTYVGVKWVSPSVFYVDKQMFALFLGIKAIDGSLFHQQGNFPTHGFIDVTSQMSVQIQLTESERNDLIAEKAKLMTHRSGIITDSCSEEEINEACSNIAKDLR